MVLVEEGDNILGVFAYAKIYITSLMIDGISSMQIIYSFYPTINLVYPSVLSSSTNGFYTSLKIMGLYRIYMMPSFILIEFGSLSINKTAVTK